jgi:glycogen debranching enzyme
MFRAMRSSIRILLLSAILASAADPGSAQATRALAFRIDEGHNINSFVRDGPVAAHLLLRSGSEPRILIAFPAGNSGVGLWFESSHTPVTWTLVSPPKPLTALDDQRRPLHGIEFEIVTDAHELRPRDAVLSSVRVLRDYELQGRAPGEVMVGPRIAGDGISWARHRLDGAAGYRLSVEALAGTRVSAERFVAAPREPLRLKVQALTGEAPLKPLNSLLTARAGKDTRARDVLAFLSYQEKFLAGSWRFDTYFGRDTLITALLLAPVLGTQAVESAIASVLDRLAPNGEVAHEEDIGEFAVMRNVLEGRGRVATPVYDYGMVDDDFLLAPLAAQWLLRKDGRARAREFLSMRGANRETHGAALARNLLWVVERAAPFAADPRATNLVAIKSGRMTGNWRDSEQGLGRGRYPYDVNAALVPAALDAAARLGESGLLHTYLDADQRRTLALARARARVWAAQAPSLFAMDVPSSEARGEIASYAKEIGVDAEVSMRSLDDDAVAFHALALDDNGRPIPILHSDEGFRLLLSQPGPAEITRCLTAIMRPFPAGLITGVGLLVANPALASVDLEREFTRFAYHGTVVWSWQQALLAAGIERQLRRTDLPSSSRAQLRDARATLWTVIERARALRSSELWSWSYSVDQDGDGHYRMEPFGRPGADVDESNAAQLWSTVFLGLTPAVTTNTSPEN